MFRQSLSRYAIPPGAFVSQLKAKGCTAYYGVPDSLLKDLCAYVTDTVSPTNNVCTANEGNAIAMATGYHLASNKIPCVYMQNSGFGNTVNPLLSLTHQDVYKIPMLLVVGWRGDPSVKADEPQHVAQGRLMDKCLEACEVPYSTIGPKDDEKSLEGVLKTAFEHFEKNGTPYALLVKKETFSPHKLGSAGTGGETKTRNTAIPKLELGREEALESIIGKMSHDDAVVSTTGMPSREVFEIRARGKMGHHRDFLTVGGMGHCSSIAAGIAMEKPDRTVYAVDGDGGSLMHLGSYAINGGLACNHNLATGGNLLDNMKHICLNNGAHDSVGGQPTVGHDVNLSGIAKECGYNVVCEAVYDQATLAEGLKKLQETPKGKGPAFLEVLIKKGNRKDLGRPTKTPQQNKADLMEFLSKKTE